MTWGRKPSCVCGTCEKCKKAAYMRERYRRQSMEERRAERARRDPERVRAASRAVHDRLKADPIYRARRRARTMVNNAIRDGRLERGPCETCGVPRAHAHHDDYAKPMEVRWLCAPCHAALHNPVAVL